MAIQDNLERSEWVQQHGNPVSYAPYIRKQPMRGSAPKPVIIQFAKGDMTVPNPTATAILRAGDLADRRLELRGDGLEGLEHRTPGRHFDRARLPVRMDGDRHAPTQQGIATSRQHDCQQDANERSDERSWSGHALRYNPAAI